MANVPAGNIDKQLHDELCCTYAALLLNDEKIPINSANIVKVINASGNKVDSFWPNIFAKSLEGKNIVDLLLGGGAGGAPAQAGPAQAAPAPAGDKKEPAKAAPKKEEKPAAVEEDAGGLGGLFD